MSSFPTPFPLVGRQEGSIAKFPVTTPFGDTTPLFTVIHDCSVVPTSDTDDPHEIWVGGTAVNAGTGALRIPNSKGWPYLNLYLVTAYSGAAASPNYSTAAKFKAWAVQTFDNNNVKNLPYDLDTTNWDPISHATMGGVLFLPLRDPRAFSFEQTFATQADLEKNSTASSGHIYTLTGPITVMTGGAHQILVQLTQAPVAANGAKHAILGQFSTYG